MQAYTDGEFSLPVAYENRPYEPIPGTAWSQIFVVHAQPSVNTMGDGGQDLLTGFLQINLNYPASEGDGSAKQKATAIREYFYAGRVFTYSGQDVFISNAGRGVTRNDDSWYQVVITINWQARVSRP